MTNFKPTEKCPGGIANCDAIRIIDCECLVEQLRAEAEADDLENSQLYYGNNISCEEEDLAVYPIDNSIKGDL